jgi:hypothetical protein
MKPIFNSSLLYLNEIAFSASYHFVVCFNKQVENVNRFH